LFPSGSSDRGKLPILGVVNLLEHVAAFFLQDLDQAAEVFDPVVDHEEDAADAGDPFHVTSDARRWCPPQIPS
jgi:hypothetical protein